MKLMSRNRFTGSFVTFFAVYAISRDMRGYLFSSVHCVPGKVPFLTDETGDTTEHALCGHDIFAI